MTNFCKDCKWMKKDWMFSPKCARAAKVEETMNYVTGEVNKSVHMFYCSTERQVFGDCKPEGLLFEPKESIWKRWFK